MPQAEITLKIVPRGTLTALSLPLFGSSVAAGFPSPADDYVEKSLDLNAYLIKKPSATYFARAQGDSMVKLGIFDKDLLIVDRSVQPQHGQIVVVAVDGALVCKVLDLHRSRLLSANPNYPPIPITDDMDTVVEGVVIHSVRHHLVTR